jgi:hypothetical protein
LRYNEAKAQEQHSNTQANVQVGEFLEVVE